VQARGEGGEEERGDGDQREELAEAHQRMARKDGVRGESGRKPGEHAVGSVQQVHDPTVGCGRASVMRGTVNVEELEADEEEGHHGAEDLASAARGERALQPHADHAREEEVHRGVDGEDEERGRREPDVGDGDSDGCGEQRQAADDGARRQQAEQQAQDEVAAEAQRKSQQRRGVEAGDAGGDSGSVDGDELPEDGDDGEQRNELAGMMPADRVPGEVACAKRRAKRHRREDGPDEQAQDDGEDQSNGLALAGLAAKTVGEDAPAQPGDGEQLRAGGNVRQPTLADLGWGTLGLLI